jgi:hypothetical protein
MNIPLLLLPVKIHEALRMNIAPQIGQKLGTNCLSKSKMTPQTASIIWQGEADKVSFDLEIE